jgi:ABC-type branched-subunit amino acid transport system ATPase component
VGGGADADADDAAARSSPATPSTPAPAAAAASSAASSSSSASSSGGRDGRAPGRLTNIAFEAKPGTLTMVVGSVASGKSSLLAALIGQMERCEGTVAVGGRVAYGAQTAWIINDSVQVRLILSACLCVCAYVGARGRGAGRCTGDRATSTLVPPTRARQQHPQPPTTHPRTPHPRTHHTPHTPRRQENIIMGEAFEPSRYAVAATAAQLAPDLALWPDGDATEIGDRGVTLSGGQRARVSIARAVYADADTYLLDDPLAAVDTHVGRALFEGCIRGVLRRKTVILVRGVAAAGGWWVGLWGCGAAGGWWVVLWGCGAAGPLVSRLRPQTVV